MDCLYSGGYIVTSIAATHQSHRTHKRQSSQENTQQREREREREREYKMYRNKHNTYKDKKLSTYHNGRASRVGSICGRMVRNTEKAQEQECSLVHPTVKKMHVYFFTYAIKFHQEYNKNIKFHQEYNKNIKFHQEYNKNKSVQLGDPLAHAECFYDTMSWSSTVSWFKFCCGRVHCSFSIGVAHSWYCCMTIHSTPDCLQCGV